MNTNATLGPWEVRELDNGKVIPTYTILGKTKSGSPVFVARVDRRSDADLIVAVFDLLDACKLAQEVIRRHDRGETGCAIRHDTELASYCGEVCLTDPDAIDGVADVLEKVIAKAEGAA